MEMESPTSPRQLLKTDMIVSYHCSMNILWLVATVVIDIVKV